MFDIVVSSETRRPCEKPRKVLVAAIDQGGDGENGGGKLPSLEFADVPE
jgi:hypothetical protein